MMKTQSATVRKNVFLTDDIQKIDWNVEEFDRYEYPKADLSKEDYGKEEMTDVEFDEWCENNLSYDELYIVPMMNCLRYFPSFCSFDKDDQKRCSNATVLVYDTYLDQWAVGMSGGGMDLAPHLLETFVNLESGVPLELAREISRNYNAYVDKRTHEENCGLLADEFKQEAVQNLQRAKELGLDI